MEDDHCKYPWDFCCEPIEQVAAASALVQVSTPAGKAIYGSLDAIAGVDAGAHVVIVGTVAKNATKDALIINAEVSTWTQTNNPKRQQKYLPRNIISKWPTKDSRSCLITWSSLAPSIFCAGKTTRLKE